jgi:3',5'-cyclic AMP phosphodiesterase CpdA
VHRTTRIVLFAALPALSLATPATSVAADAVARVITSSSDLLAGTAAQGQLGDFLLSNGDIKVVIENVDHDHGDGLSGGNVVDLAAAPAFVDQLGSSFALLGAWPRQAVYSAVSVEEDGSGGTAVILASGVDSGNGNLHIATRYSLSPNEHFVTIETEIVNVGGAVTGYQAGDALSWGSGNNFVPGYGFDVSYQTTVSEWIGSAGASSSYAYAMTSGSLQADHGPAWSDPIVLWADIAAGGTASYTRTLVPGALGLASATNVVHEIQGTTTGLLEGVVTDQATHGPVAGATVDCDVNGIAPYTQIASDALGHYAATLPPASYSLAVTAPGYSSDDGEAIIAAGGTTTANFVLRPNGWTPGKGDTLTVVMRPILSVPAITTPGASFIIEAMAPPLTTGWSASLRHSSRTYSLAITGAAYMSDHQRWFMNARLPGTIPAEVYDLVVHASGGVADTVAHAVAVRDSISDDFYFIQFTDTHLPVHRDHSDPGAESDTTEMDDLHAVIDDINIMNPAFVLMTGDLVNEGELEDYLGWRVFTKAARILSELQVPVYVVPGNHDIGGWPDTPPPPGSSRWAWWSFFGWRYLYAPPPADLYTQDYSFDYGQARFIGMEAYDNYDDWRTTIYGPESFTASQTVWLTNEIATADPAAAKVAFYHYDFDHELNLAALGIDGALWGHVHSSTGSISSHPFNLSLDTVADGNRAMRLVRVSGNQVHPSAPMSAGLSGEKLRVTFDPANDGTASTVTATVVNGDRETFENALVRFRVRADSIPYAVSNGELTQTIVEDGIATCYVTLNVPFQNTTSVTIEPTVGPADTLGGKIALLKQSRPNPARTGTTIGFVLAAPRNVTLDILDVAGRLVATVARGPRDTGPQEATWDLKNEDGLAVASGIYFYRLDVGDETITRKLVVVR